MTNADFIANLKKRLSVSPLFPMHGMRAVIIAHGQPYIGVSRPKGYRARTAKQCFWNAADLASNNRGIYVEGYASFGPKSLPIHHAWVTLDGIHAIDPTWDFPDDCYYAGIAFPVKIVARYGLPDGYCVPSLTDHEPSAALRALLAEAA